MSLYHIHVSSLINISYLYCIITGYYNNASKQLYSCILLLQLYIYLQIDKQKVSESYTEILSSHSLYLVSPISTRDIHGIFWVAMP